MAINLNNYITMSHCWFIFLGVYIKH